MISCRNNFYLDILGSPVLGYLAAGVLIGPYGLSIIRNVHGTKAIAEFGVVFLLFNIGLEVHNSVPLDAVSSFSIYWLNILYLQLSVERLSSMKKYVFGLGSAQVLFMLRNHQIIILSQLLVDKLEQSAGAGYYCSCWCDSSSFCCTTRTSSNSYWEWFSFVINSCCLASTSFSTHLIYQIFVALSLIRSLFVSKFLFIHHNHIVS